MTHIPLSRIGIVVSLLLALAHPVAFAASSSSSSSAGAIAISITDGIDTVRNGGDMIYLLTLRQDSQDSRTLDVNVSLPFEADIITPNKGGIVSGKNIRWDDVVLLRGVQESFTIQVNLRSDISEGTTILARASAGGYEATDSTLIQSYPSSGASQDFAVSITDNHSIVAPDQSLTHTVTVTNRSSIQRTTDVRVTMSQFLTVSSTSPSIDSTSNTYVWSGEVFRAGESKTYSLHSTVLRRAPEYASIVTSVTAGGKTSSDTTSVQTSAALRSSSSRSSFSSSSRRSTTTSRVALFSKIASAQEATPGSVILYTLRVHNTLTTTINDAIITDRFDPSLLTLLDRAGGRIVNSGQIEWTVPRLQPGQQWSVQYRLLVADNLPNGTQLNNIASIAGNDLATATLTERVVVASTGVIGQLPTTGAATDVLFVLLSVPAALAIASLHRKIRV